MCHSRVQAPLWTAMGPGAPPIHVEPGLGEWLFNRWFSTQPVDGEMTTAALQQAHRHHRTTAPAPPHPHHCFCCLYIYISM